MMLAVGVALLLLGLFAMLLSRHFKDLRYFDRPTVARNPYFDPSLDLLKWLLLAAGLLALWRASRPVCLVASAALLGLGAYRRVIKSRLVQSRLLRREYAALKRERRGMSDGDILFELAYRRHARWGQELIEQMVKDYPTFEEFSRMMVRMERGFRGFRGRRPSSGSGEEPDPRPGAG
ncbi:MAG TPA: hypothetical protein VKF61_10485 [Candidatus Polarisedimenticolia bacterium]|nr:hypothetical protein [Candidatus Polarisedimenticolia bacterium]